MTTTRYNLHALCGCIITIEIKGNKDEVQKKKREVESAVCSKCKNLTVYKEDMDAGTFYGKFWKKN